MKFSYYPGCTLKNQAQALDRYARLCLEKLDCELVELDAWQCCGGVYISSKDEIACKLPAIRALIAAEQSGTPLVTVCSACHNTLKQTAVAFERDKEFAQKVNAYLAQEKNPVYYNGGAKVYHYLELLRDVIGFENVKKAVTQPLGDKIGAYYGCLLLRPSSVMATDDPENPSILEELISALGGTAIPFPMRNECCGGYTVLEDKMSALKKSSTIIKNARSFGTERLVTACPLCRYNLLKSDTSLPVIYFTQAIAEAFGIKEKDNG